MTAHAFLRRAALEQFAYDIEENVGMTEAEVVKGCTNVKSVKGAGVRDKEAIDRLVALCGKDDGYARTCALVRATLTTYSFGRNAHTRTHTHTHTNKHPYPHPAPLSTSCSCC